MPPVPTGGTIKNKLTVPDPDANGVVSFTSNQINYQFDIEKSHDIALEEIDAPAIIMIQSLGDSTIKYITNKFLLQSVTKPRMERFQIIETFRQARLYFFGERTKVYSITGQVLEAFDSQAAEGDTITRDQYRWSTSLQTLYDTALRGSQLAASGNIATLIFEKVLLTGYPLQLQITRSVDSPFLAQFQMTWAIYNEEFLDNYSGYQYSLHTDEKVRNLQKQLTDLIDKIDTLSSLADHYQGSHTSDDYISTYEIPLQQYGVQKMQLIQQIVQLSSAI